MRLRHGRSAASPDSPSPQRHRQRLGFALACLALIAVVALAPAAAGAAGHGQAASGAKKKAKPLTKKQVIKLIERYAGRGPEGKAGKEGPAGTSATIDGVAAGGALAGSYPGPTLNVSGGDEGATACKNGEALRGLSTAAALSCGPGVFEEHGNGNLGLGGYHGGTGADNTASGFEALHKNTIGGGDTASGEDALFDNTSGEYNTASGTAALEDNTTGSDNIALGFLAGASLTTGSDNIDIGNTGAAGESNTIKIGAGQAKAFLAGVNSASIGAGTAVLVNSNGQLGTTTSSRRFKHDIHPIGAQLRRLMALRPVSFRYKRRYVQGPTPVQYGLIAEQVAKVYPNLVVDNKNGRPTAVAYQELPALLLAKAQQQQHQIDALRAQGRRLDRQRAALRRERRMNRNQNTQIAALQRAVARLGRER